MRLNILFPLIVIIPLVLISIFSAEGFRADVKNFGFSDSLTNQDSAIILKENFSKGKKLYEKKCNKCHTLYEPGDFAVKVWKKNLKEMKIKAELTSDEYDLILYYLVSSLKQK